MHRRRTNAQPSARRLLAGASAAAIALGCALAPAGVRAQTHQSMVAMQAGRVVLPDGSVSQWSGANLPRLGRTADGRALMTIEQIKAKALLDWEKFQLNTDEVLEFAQQSRDWIAVNRVHGADAARIDGEVRAAGRVFVFNDNGVLIGKDARINVRQLVTGAGVSDVNVEGNVTSIVQGASKAVLNWSDMSSQAGEVLRFQQEKRDWIALNRSLRTGTTTLAGSIEANGQVWLVAREGLAIDGSVKAAQVIASALDISEQQFAAGLTGNVDDPGGNGRTSPQFSNTWINNPNPFSIDRTPLTELMMTPAPVLDDPQDPLRYKMTVGRSGAIETDSYGKVMLFGPKVVNAGLVTIKDEGQVILAAGDNVYLRGDGRNVTAYTGAFNPVDVKRIDFGAGIYGLGTVQYESDVRFWKMAYGLDLNIGDQVPDASNRFRAYLDNLQIKRARDTGFVARNEGIIRSQRGGRIDFRGMTLEQAGAIEMTSTALFRGALTFKTAIYDLLEFPSGSEDGPLVPGNGDVIFGRNSLTQITPDLYSTDTLPLSSGTQSVGSVTIEAARVHMQEDAMMYLPSGTVSVLLDEGAFVKNGLGSNRGAGANQNNETGTRFLMDRGATIDLSGWSSTLLPMGYHQVSGRLFSAQLADSPLQRDGPFYRKEILVDRRFGTDLANWQSFDNLNQGRLPQFLLNGGKFQLDVDDDFIMMPGSVIDVSGGKITYEAGYVRSSLLRTLDNRVIDIREADPDQIYMGFANQFSVYDEKWRTQRTYFIPFMTSSVGRYEDSYTQGGNGGVVDILAPDALLYGTLKGRVTIGKYQRSNLPTGGVFKLNDADDTETEYVGNNVLIGAMQMAVPTDFGLTGKLSDVFGDMFGVERDLDDRLTVSERRSDNGTLTSADMFNRSTMGSYYIKQTGREDAFLPGSPALVRNALLVEKGVAFELGGASLELESGHHVGFFGSFRSPGGALAIRGASVSFAADSRIDTRGGWFNDTGAGAGSLVAPRINGGAVSLGSGITGGLSLPAGMAIEIGGGGWVQADGTLVGGRGGDLVLAVSTGADADFANDLSAIADARSLGLGGNGSYTLFNSRGLVIGDALTPEQQAAKATLIRPSFFDGSGFGAIALDAPSITVTSNTQVFARATSLTPSPDVQDLPTGTDILAAAQVGVVPIERRTGAAPAGLALSFKGGTAVEEGARIAVEPLGSIKVSGSAFIDGTLEAPAGSITLVGGNGVIALGERAELLARGVVIPKVEGIADEQLLPGGVITLASDTVTVKAGALVDVSGAATTLDVPYRNEAGAIVTRRVEAGSDGGSISIGGTMLDFDAGTYLGRAGAANARGGKFAVSFLADFKPGKDGPSAEDITGAFQWIFDAGFVVDKQGAPVTSFYGIDLGTVDWDALRNMIGYDFSFDDGVVIESREALVDLLNRHTVAAAGNAPLFLVGDKVERPSIEPVVIPAIDPGLRKFLETFGYQFAQEAGAAPPLVTLSTGRLAGGGFGTLGIAASPAIIFAGDTSLGGRRADGSYVFDRLDITTGMLTAVKGAKVSLEARVVTLAHGQGASKLPEYLAELGKLGVSRDNADTQLTVKASALLQVQGTTVHGMADTLLASEGDLRLVAPLALDQTQGRSLLQSTGALRLQADQVYANSGGIVTIASDRSIAVLKQDAPGAINAAPMEAAAQLTLRAPEIVQGGTIRSPLGSITFDAVDNGTEGAGAVRLLPGSLTSVSADGITMPYGLLQNGDTWIDPITRAEFRSLPAKTVNLNGRVVDLQAGASIDVAGSGDLYAREFVPGLGGSTDWTTGYRDANYDWVADASQVFAVLPGYSTQVAPFGINGNTLGVGDQIYLAGGSGLAAGTYTLLPASYAVLPGAFRVTANHHYKGDFASMVPGAVAPLLDGSSIQAGYRLQAGTAQRDPLTSGFLVMNGDTLRLRTEYREARATSFFSSAAFLQKALRTNSPLGDVPRLPIDGGSVVIRAADQLRLEATLKSAAAKGGRGGFADIDAGRIAVVGAGTDVSRYDGYLLLDSDRLNSFGAESILLGGVRRQGDVNLELAIGASDVVVDNAGSALRGPELLFAATKNVIVAPGAAIETSGTIAGSSGDLRLLPSIPAVVDEMGTIGFPYDDVKINDLMDQGALLRVSSGVQVDILRDVGAVDRFAALVADPVQLAAINAKRVALGLQPLAAAGNLTIADGASVRSGRSIAFDATTNTVLAPGATVSARQMSAAASRVSLGEVPVGTAGLVFAGGSLGALAAAEDIALKSYSSIDFYGPATLRADNAMTLDTRLVHVLAAEGRSAVIGGKALTFTNSNGGTAQAVSGGAQLRLEGETIAFAGGDKWFGGIDSLAIAATGRVIGQDENTVHVPGALSISAGAVTASSGSRLFFDATGAVSLASLSGAALPAFETFGATLGITGASIVSDGRIALTGGTVSLRARDGDVLLREGSLIDVTSNASRIFDVTVGVGAGAVTLTSDRGNVLLSGNAGIDVSGSVAGGDAGTLNVSAALGSVLLGSGLRGDAAAGSRSGSFALVSDSLDFAALNGSLDTGGFRQGRSFTLNRGDVRIDGTVRAQEFTLVANAGTIDFAGTVETPGADGGRVQLSAQGGVNLLAGSRILARGRDGGSGGTVLLETVGGNGGRIDLAAGALIDVSGTGEGGRLVRIRAPQQGGDVAIGRIDGRIEGARTVLAEAFRVYDGVTTIDAGLIAQVSADATQFMAAADPIRARLGAGITLSPGIELRSNGDMTLATDWDLHALRFDGAAGVLTLRAAGDLKLDANLSDGFDGATPGAALLPGASWTFNLTAGANVTSPNSLATLSLGQLAAGKGSLIVGGTPDTVEYYYDPAYGNENRLYLLDADGRFVQQREAFGNYHLGWVELQRNADGKYVDPLTGVAIEKDPVTGDYADTGRYARRPLPYLYFSEGGGLERMAADGSIPPYDYNASPLTARSYIQYDNSTGYMVRTGTGGINAAAGRDLVLQYRPSVIYTAGERAPDLPGFYAPAGAYYGIDGGDLSLRAAGSVIGSASPQQPGNWLIRRISLTPDGSFATVADRPLDQTTWYVDYNRFEAGVGALGGGNVSVEAAGDVVNLSASVPSIGRMSGNAVGDDPARLFVNGGGDLSIRAGGNIGSGVFFIGEGQGAITAGGAFISTNGVRAATRTYATDEYGSPFTDTYGPDDFNRLATYTTLYTSRGQFKLQSGGDLNIDAVLDPLLPLHDADLPYGGESIGVGFLSFNERSSVELFSAGGDINIWNQGANINLQARLGMFRNPTYVVGTSEGAYNGIPVLESTLWPGTVRAVAATGDINVLGGLVMAPAATGTLDLLAGREVHIGLSTRKADAFSGTAPFPACLDARCAYEGIYMSQSVMSLFRTPEQPIPAAYYNLGEFALVHFMAAGPGSLYPGITNFTRELAPDLHVGDTQPVRIYAGTGDIVTSAEVNFPKAARIQAGGDIYFPALQLQHNNLNDLSVVRARGGLYFNGSSHIDVAGPGRLEVETGGDLYIPSNNKGISSMLLTLPDPIPGDAAPAEALNPGQKAADIGITVGIDQTPNYAGFEARYILPGAGQPEYVLKDAGDGRMLPVYLFDRVYSRGDRDPDTAFMSPEIRAGFVNWLRAREGLKPLETTTEQAAYFETAYKVWERIPAGEKTPYDAFIPRAGTSKVGAVFYLPEERQGLVNYVRVLQGLEPLATQGEQLAYLDTALAFWNAVEPDQKIAFYRDVLNLELRQTGRDANNVDGARYNTTFRGYDALALLYPGAQERAGEQLADGEARWTGNFETYASKVLSVDGGNISVTAPGGFLGLANVAATPDETGQPPSNNGRGDAKRAGFVSLNGGRIDVVTHDSVTLNQSRMITAGGGNIFVWSSYGDIAAGAGAKTSISPTFFDYTLDVNFSMNRTPVGLPTGAGIATVQSIAGAAEADVDLVAPNGIVDAGDAGIRVSGNFNVFAVEVLGTDNIDVAGVVLGLPATPSAPPLQTDELSAKSNDVVKAINAAVRSVQNNAATLAPSIIEVRVTGFGRCDDPKGCPDERGGGGPSAAVAPSRAASSTPGAAAPVRLARAEVEFNLPSQPTAAAIRSVGQMTGVNIIYDSEAVKQRVTPALKGRMDALEALRRLLRDSNLTIDRIDPTTVVVRAQRG